MIRKQIYKFERHIQTRDNLNLQNYYKILSIYWYVFKAEMFTDYIICLFGYCRISVIDINFIFFEVPAIVTFSHIREAYIKKMSNKSVQAQTLRSARFMILSLVLICIL